MKNFSQTFNSKTKVKTYRTEEAEAEKAILTTVETPFFA